MSAGKQRGESRRSRGGRRRTATVLVLATVLSAPAPAALATNEVSISPTGPANATVLAVSGTGNASGGVVGVTATGDASGPVSVDPSRTAGTVYGAAWETARDIFDNTGVNPEETVYQLYAIATSPPPDLNSDIEKQKRQVENAKAMVEGTLASPPPVLEQSTPHRAPYASETAPISGFGQPNGWSCVPSSARTLFAHRGMPDFSTLYREMGTDEALGTTLPAAAAVIRRHYTGPSQPKLDRVNDRLDLMSKAVTAITDYDQGFMIAVSTAHLPWWRNGDGTPRQGQHVLSGYAYVPMRGWAPGRAWVRVWDSQRSSAGWGSGSHGILSDDLVLAAVNGVGLTEMNIIW